MRLTIASIAVALASAACLHDASSARPDTEPPTASPRAGVAQRDDGRASSASAPTPATAVTPRSRVAAPEERAVDALLARMTLAEKVGQLMMVGVTGHSVDASTEALVRGRRVGGVCLFRRNIASAEQVARLNDALWHLLGDGVPPFLAVDQEGGNVVRVTDKNLVLPGNMLLGATRSPALAYEAGRSQGADLRRLGFNMNFAPVLDVNVNPRNPVIGIRAFGDDAELVSRLGSEFIRGQQEAMVATVVKHFPGHGPVETDSHQSLPIVQATAEELEAHLRPFAAAVAASVDAVMTAHIATPALTGDTTPATLSSEVLDGVLRRRLGFDGLIITDELEMAAIERFYGVGRAAVLAVNAGADMVLVPWRAERKVEVYERLLAAARSGELSAPRLDEAVRRVLRTKLRRGVFDAPAPLEQRLAELGRDGELAREIARAGVTLLRYAPGRFPLRSSEHVLVVTAEPALAAAVERRAPNAAAIVVPPFPRPGQRESLRRHALAMARGSDSVVVGVVNANQVALVNTLAATGRPVVVVLMGAPYLALQLRRAKTVLAVYSYRESAADAAAAALFGEAGTPGKLPVAMPSHPFGSGKNPVGTQSSRALPRGIGAAPRALPDDPASTRAQ